MESVGAHLKKTREAQGLTLDQVASKTRIQPRLLQALEEEDFEKLPGEVFAKGFLRAYSRFLEIDEEDMVHRFAVVSNVVYRKDQEEVRLRQQEREESRKRAFHRNGVIIGTILTLVALVALLVREQSSSPPQHEQGKPDAVVEQAQVSTVQNVEELNVAAGEQTQPNIEPSVPISSAHSVTMRADTFSVPHAQASTDESVEEASRAPVNESEGLVLELEAKEMTWVVVRPDGTEPHEALLQPGEKVTWEAKQNFLITLGNAGGVAATLNGKPLGPFGKVGAVVRDVEIPKL